MAQYRYRFPLALLTVIVLVAGSEPVSAQQPLNLDSCIVEALAHNPQIGRARQQVKLSELQRRQASSALLPSLSLTGAFSRYTSVSPQRLLNPATNQIVEGSSTALTTMTYYSGLNLSQSLYNRSTTALYTQARAGEQTAIAEAEMQSQLVVLQVYQAYYFLLRAQRNLEVAETDTGYNTELLRQVKTMFEMGNRAKVDVLRQESALAQSQQRLISAGNSVKKARAELNFQMGADPTRPLEIVDDLELVPQEVSFEASLEQAMVSHPVIRQASLRITAAEAGVNAVAASRYPSMNLSGNYSWRGDSYLDITDAFSSDYTWSVGVGLYLNIFDGMRTGLNLQKAQVNLAGAERDRFDAERNVIRDVHGAVLDLQEAEQVLKTARRAVDLANEALRLAEEMFRIGSMTLLEVNASQFDLINAQYQEVQALFNLKIARASLDYSMGLLR